MNKTCTKCGEVKLISEFWCSRRGKNGHRSSCKDCDAKQRREYHKANREKFAAITRRWLKVNRFSWALITSRKNAKERGYIPCLATKEELEVAFTGYCGICGISEDECATRLCLDHDHETGEFRGWLCHKCNIALGGFGDSEKLLIAALHYLRGITP